ncbi:MAG: helicase, partial [Beijerinckiaceae bacterium]|nr:helicase [Beijerinckiaceae bacterium]
MNISFPASRQFARDRSRGVTVLLGPTNTGKTHYAIERMLSYSSGMIGLPLRLLAREVYNRAVEKAGADAVALITGEEKIKPKAPRYWISTVEAMPRNLVLPFVAVDEIQLAAGLDRGHVFTGRLLNCRGREETLLIGAATMTGLVRELLPGAKIRTRPRLSELRFAGDRKLTRLPRRSAIVAFSAEDVYAIAEWIRRQSGGAAVVLGALSPRTRNAQVAMFQNGDVDYIVATDAIGMGLNLDVGHIAFASNRKFDGWQYRQLTPAEFGQIAGRAGRHCRDGTFGTTGRCPPFDPAIVEALEEHRFDELRVLQWRNTELDFTSTTSLAASLDALPKEPGLTRAPLAADQIVLDIAARDGRVVRMAKSPAGIVRLWDCCQIPDYRKLSPSAHAELVLSVFGFVAHGGHIPDDWFARHVAAQDRVDGDLDTLSARIAEVRTWTFIANRSGWLRDPGHWQTVTRQVEDRLSDALHERLAQRFVDRRTSVLMRRLRENAMLEAEVTPGGDVMVEGQHVGHLTGFHFTADPEADGEAAKTLNAAAQKALASEIEGRARRLSEAVDSAILLANDGIIRWLGEAVGRLCAGGHVLEPRVSILAGEQLTGQALLLAQRRLDLWLAQHVTKLLGALSDLEKGEGLGGIARGIAFQLAEALGVLDRARVAEDVKGLSQDARAALRKFGVRFGAYHLYLPNLIKPAPRALAAQLYALKHGEEAIPGLDDLLHLAASGRTSFAASNDIPKGLYRAAGFRICGDRAVRVDILERLADLIRPAVSYRPGVTPGEPPPGAADGDGFIVTVAMTSLAGCSGEGFASILRALSYTCEQRKGPPITLTSTRPDGEVAPGPAETAALPAEPALEADEEAGAAEAVSQPAEDGLGGASIGIVSPATPVPEDTASHAAGPDEAAEDSLSAGDANGTGAALDGIAGVDPLIEVWRPHKVRHHPRKAEARSGKRHAGRREGAPAPGPKAAKAEVSAEPAQAKLPAEGHAMPAAAGDAQAAPHGETQSAGSDDNARQAGQEHAGERERHMPRPRGGARRRDRQQAGEQNRNEAGNRKEWRSEHASRKETKPNGKPPDPNSPFAKLLLLKARMEEKNN